MRGMTVNGRKEGIKLLNRVTVVLSRYCTFEVSAYSAVYFLNVTAKSTKCAEAGKSIFTIFIDFEAEITGKILKKRTIPQGYIL